MSLHRNPFVSFLLQLYHLQAPNASVEYIQRYQHSVVVVKVSNIETWIQFKIGYKSATIRAIRYICVPCNIECSSYSNNQQIFQRETLKIKRGEYESFIVAAH